MPATTQVKPSSGSMRAGFYIPGVFAAGLTKAVELGSPRRFAVDLFMRMQAEVHITCPTCGGQEPVAIWSRRDARRLYDLARKMPHAGVLSQIEEEYAEHNFVCPNCGTRGRLRDHH